MWSDYQHIRVRSIQDVLIIELIDPKLFDTEIVTQLQDELLRLVDTDKPHKLVVDFARVVHCSTAVINGLLRVRRRMLRQDGCLQLCGMSNTIRDAYRMLNLDGTVFPIQDTLDEALARF